MKTRIILLLLSMFAGAARGQLLPDDVSTNLSPVLDEPPPITLGQVTLTCAPFLYSCNGIAVRYGNASGNYSQLEYCGDTNVFTVSNLDETRPWFLSLCAWANNPLPVILTNVYSSRTNVVTNWQSFGPNSVELFCCWSNVAASCTVSNGNVLVIWWGKINQHYSVLAGGEMDDLTDDVFDADGTNGPEFYAEPIDRTTNRFFEIQVSGG